MIKTLTIYIRLLKSLPRDVRNDFSLIMDPAAGTVAVSSCYYGLSFEGLTHTIAVARPYGVPFQYDEPTLLAQSWMELLKANFRPRVVKDMEPHRFLVSSDYRIKHVGLACQWAIFVHLALALGVDPYRSELLDLYRGMPNPALKHLKSSAGKTIISVTTNDASLIGALQNTCSFFSLARSLAWVSTMVIYEGTTLHLVPLRRRFGSYQDSYERKDLQYHSAEEDRHARDSGRETIVAFVWVLYAESAYHSLDSQDRAALGNEGLLPVNQRLLKTREDVIKELETVTSLEALLRPLFPETDQELVTNILEALRHEWQTPDVVITESTREGRPFMKGQLSGAEDPPGYIDIWTKIQQNETFIALKDNYNPNPTLRTRTDADLISLTSPMGLLARVIIAVSVIQKWPRRDWGVVRDSDDNVESWTLPPDPMEELLTSYEPTFWISLW